MFNPPQLADVQARLRDVPNIDQMSLTEIGGRIVFGLNGRMVALVPGASDELIDSEIRRAFGDPMVDTTNPIAARAAAEVPLATVVPPPVTMTFTPESKPMTMPAPGSFAASLRALMNEARAGVEQARADGLAQVGDAVSKLNEAKAATRHVAGNMAKTIEDEAAAVLRELGQISNDLGGA